MINKERRKRMLFKRKKKIYFFPSVVQADNEESLRLLEKVRNKFRIIIVPQKEFYAGLSIAFSTLVTDEGVCVGVEDITFFVQINI